MKIFKVLYSEDYETEVVPNQARKTSFEPKGVSQGGQHDLTDCFMTLVTGELMTFSSATYQLN